MDYNISINYNNTIINNNNIRLPCLNGSSALNIYCLDIIG